MKPKTAAQLEAALDAIDIAAAEARLVDAERQRQHFLLATSEDAPVLAAEAAIASARIARDRAVAMKAELARQLAERRKADERAAFDAKYRAAERLAIEAERRIRDEYPALAKAIIAIAEAEAAADDAVTAINADLIDMDDAPPALETPSARIWGSKYLRPFAFREGVSMPETDGNPAFGAAASFVTREAAYALGGVGQGPAIPAFQFR